MPPEDVPESAVVLDLPVLDDLLAVAEELDTDSPLSDGRWQTQPWQSIIGQLAKLDGRPAYIGTFSKAIDATCELADELDETDRRLLCRLVVDRVMARGTNWGEVRHGVHAARRIHPPSFAPESLIGTLLATALRHPPEAERPAPAVYALFIAIELLADAGTQAIRPQDVWPIRAAVALMPDPQRDELSRLVQHVHWRDRRVLEEMVSPRPRSRLSRLLAR